MRTINIDFETRSTVPLNETGIYPYATDPTTEPLCMAFSEEGMEPMLWVPGDEIPGSVMEAKETGANFRAWNAAFERAIWREIMVPRFGFPKLAMRRWVCTQMEASAMALPRSLDKCARVLRVKEQKDDAGHRLMKQMSRPRKARKGEDPNLIYWWEDEVRLNKLYAYCLQDVRTEVAVAHKLRRLTKQERRLYLLDQRANDRGVGLDLPLIHAACGIRDEAVARANKKLAALTDRACREITNTANLRKWLDVSSIDKAAIKELLLTEPEGPRREVIQLRADVGKSSVAKLDTMLKVEHHGSAHGLLQFLGADTGRWAGRLIQPQNFPRPPKWIEDMIPLVLAGDYDAIAKLHPPMEVLAGMLRSMLVARPPARFLCADFSAIEGWVVAWLAGQDGMTSYEDMASRIFDIPADEIGEDSDERAVGKVAVLGCGFGMGWKKYQETVYDWTGIRISDELAQLVVNTYRDLNHQIKSLWYELENAAVAAVRHPGRIVNAGRGGCIRYRVKGPYLWAALPSKRALCYPLPVLKSVITPWGAAKEAVVISTTNSYTRKWERRTLYGGLQTENLVQALARDVMAEAMLRTEAEGYPSVLTVHDEILAEAEGGSLDTFCDLMKQTPTWADGLRVRVKGWEGERYRK